MFRYVRLPDMLSFLTIPSRSNDDVVVEVHEELRIRVRSRIRHDLLEAFQRLVVINENVDLLSSSRKLDSHYVFLLFRCVKHFPSGYAGIPHSKIYVSRTLCRPSISESY